MTSVTDDKQNWREKYLNVLDAQEQFEREFKAQTELLRRALVRLSLSAEGQSESMDQLLEQLREHLRSGNSIEALLARLDHLGHELDQRRDSDSQELRAALSHGLHGLQKMDLSRGLIKSLQDYLVQLPQRVKKPHLYPALMQQFAELQQAAIAELQMPKSSVLQKILGGKKPAAGTQPAAKPLEVKPVEIKQIEIKQVETKQAETGAVTKAELAETWFKDLTRTLDDFFAQLEANLQIKEDIGVERQRLAKLLASADLGSDEPLELLAIVTRVRQLVSEAYLTGNQAFAGYLDNVNRELLEIYSLLGGAVESSSQRRNASAQLQVDMLREMTQLEQSSANATDLNQLKNQVKSQLGNIRQALDKYQQTELQQEQLAQQLSNLGEKLKVMEVEAEKSRANLEQQRHRALHDPLTELPNREAYKLRSQEEISRWQRYGGKLSLVVIDIDHFKQINDSFGHQTGDRVLKVIGRSIAKRLREVDFFCRYGGEEFVALMPETGGQAALQLMEKIRDSIARASFNYKDQPITISISAGVSEIRTGDSLEQVFERADQALYAAKNAGRNACRLL